MGPLAVFRPILTTVLGHSGFLLSVDLRWGAIARFRKGTMAGTMQISTTGASLVGTNVGVYVIGRRVGTCVASARVGVCTVRMNVVSVHDVAGVGPITEGASGCTPNSITST
jgi:hypothetical protein